MAWHPPSEQSLYWTDVHVCGKPIAQQVDIPQMNRISIRQSAFFEDTDGGGIFGGVVRGKQGSGYAHWCSCMSLRNLFSMRSRKAGMGTRSGQGQTRS